MVAKPDAAPAGKVMDCAAPGDVGPLGGGETAYVFTHLISMFIG